MTFLLFGGVTNIIIIKVSGRFIPPAAAAVGGSNIREFFFNNILINFNYPKLM